MFSLPNQWHTSLRMTGWLSFWRICHGMQSRESLCFGLQITRMVRRRRRKNKKPQWQSHIYLRFPSFFSEYIPWKTQFSYRLCSPSSKWHKRQVPQNVHFFKLRCLKLHQSGFSHLIKVFRSLLFANKYLFTRSSVWAFIRGCVSLNQLHMWC